MRTNVRLTPQNTLTSTFVTTSRSATVVKPQVRGPFWGVTLPLRAACEKVRHLPRCQRPAFDFVPPLGMVVYPLGVGVVGGYSVRTGRGLLGRLANLV
jgi:hypothetical protein